MAKKKAPIDLVEKIAANCMMLEADDPAALTAQAVLLKELAGQLEAARLGGVDEAAATAALLESMAAGHCGDTVAALETVTAVVTGLQALVKGKQRAPAKPTAEAPPAPVDPPPPPETPEAPPSPAPPPAPSAPAALSTPDQPTKKETASMTQPTESVVEKNALAGKYLTFKLAAEDYGLEILKVQEIIKMMDITKVPRTPDFVRGVINLRGKVIPVVDLRLKFEMQTMETTDKTCIIVVQVANRDSTVTTGIIVDEVSEVLDITEQEIEPAPSFGTQVDTRFILGMAKAKGTVKILLDIDRVLSGGDVEALAGFS